MPDWDEDSPLLRKNLAEVMRKIVRAANTRDLPTLEMAKQWQAGVLSGLGIPNPRFAGSFRGEPGLENVAVQVGANHGTAPENVASELARFEIRLQSLVASMDSMLPSGAEPDADQLAAIIDLCAWVHAEWVRIHPFANCNGRTARLWANSLAVRYGLPPFVTLRPRPNTGCAEAGAKGMQGKWTPTAFVFRRLLDEFLKQN